MVTGRDEEGIQRGRGEFSLEEEGKNTDGFTEKPV